MLVKNQIFGQKDQIDKGTLRVAKFWSKIEILEENRNLEENRKF